VGKTTLTFFPAWASMADLVCSTKREKEKKQLAEAQAIPLLRVEKRRLKDTYGQRGK